MKDKKACFSSNSDDWATPKEYNYWTTFDPCPLNADFDGLIGDWHGKVLLNPPYSNPLQRAFVEKAIEQIPNCEKIVLLLPARTDTKLFHELLYNKFEIKFIKGRLKFGNSKNSAPFPSMLVILKDDSLL